MKKALVIIPNLLIMGLILAFIVGYANSKAKESDRSVIDAYERSALYSVRVHVRQEPEDFSSKNVIFHFFVLP